MRQQQGDRQTRSREGSIKERNRKKKKRKKEEGRIERERNIEGMEQV